MGCFQTKERSISIAGNFNSDLQEPRNTIQKFPYQKVLTSLPFREEIMELSQLEGKVHGKNSQPTSTEKNKYLKLRTAIQGELNKLNKKLGNTEEFLYLDTKGIKVEQLQWFDFVDPYFPPGQQSLFDSRMSRHPMADTWEAFTWKRPADIYGEGNYDIFREINPNDVKQGYCGDCYYLSALSGLAEFPDRIRKIFQINKINSIGFYEVTLYITGEKKTVYVDDYFPYSGRDEDWAFSKSVDNEIWVLILEKAWAKVHGNYQRIEGGNTAEALMAITGAYVDYIFHNQVFNKDILWRRIFNADQNKYVIATSASSKRTGKQSDQLKDFGIVDAHAYTLIEAQPIMTSDKSKVRLLQLRNPWGFEEWKGDWSDHDKTNWTEDLKRKLNYEAREDGVFYIDFENYLGYYYNTTVCKYQKGEDFQYYYDVDTWREYSIFQFRVNRSKMKTKVFLSVNQLNKRFYTKNQSFEYAGVKVMVAKVVEDQLKFVDGDAAQFSSVQVELADLPSGQYLVFWKPKWNHNHHCRNLVCSIYINQETEISRTHYTKYSPTIMRTLETWLQEIMSLGKDYQRQDLEDDPEGDAEPDQLEEEEKVPLNEETKESAFLSRPPPVMKQTETSLDVISSSKFLKRKSKILDDKCLLI